MAHSQTVRVPSAAPQSPTTIIEFLLDETGSMASCIGATVNGFNDFLKEQQSQPGKCLLTLTKFDTSGEKTPYVDLAVGLVPPMTTDTFVPGGGTNLRDTIGNRIYALKQRLASWSTTPNVLFVVMTDGDDNASREFTENHIRSALSDGMENLNWSFVYLGANTHALATAARLGFPEGNAKAFSTVEMRQTMETLAKATTAYRATRATTSTADRDFFANNR